ncbi:MAG: hypothetical protein IT477_10900 [Rhodanobacteraceae bacterium]|nr:hypothetical protein [Rhodanobacteraceae bacterium]
MKSPPKKKGRPALPPEKKRRPWSLCLTPEAAQVIDSLPMGHRARFVCDAIMAYAERREEDKSHDE